MDVCGVMSSERGIMSLRIDFPVQIVILKNPSEVKSLSLYTQATPANPITLFSVSW